MQYLKLWQRDFLNNQGLDEKSIVLAFLEEPEMATTA